MKNEELNEIEEIAKTSASSCWMMGIFFLGLKRKAHHPREATLVAKNTMPTPVGACIARPQNTDILQIDNQNNNAHVGAGPVSAHKSKLQPLCGGITLISLIITIIILLILAGVTINLTLGENGIFGLAEKAGKNYMDAQNKELAELDNLYSYIDNARLPENTPNTEAGTVVKIPESWYSEISAFYEAPEGKEVKASQRIASVYGVSDGSGNTIPIPKGFYYVGVDIKTGIVISDNEKDKNKYANYTATGEIKEGIPSGVAYNEDGTVNIEKSELKGNQFVWIPCEAKDYVKKSWGANANGANSWNATWEKQTHTSELIQIEKYGGFYIGRYEAGTSNIKLSTNVDFSAANTASGWINDSFSIRDGLSHTATGKITTKAGEIPYYHADYFTALKLSNSMYDTNYVQSGLVTGTMWDAMLKYIAENDENVVTKSTWGNYTNGSVTYTAGKGRYTGVDSGNGAMTSVFTKSDGAYHYGIKTTGISEDVKKKNIYDVAGNLWEWTQEAAYVNLSETYIFRGSSFYNSYADHPACYRGSGTATYTGTNIGFRPALYIK